MSASTNPLIVRSSITSQPGPCLKPWARASTVFSEGQVDGLDFVLAHPEHRYLATETEKLEFFVGALGLKREWLPLRIYRSRNGRTQTTRYFVDKFPLFLSGASSAPAPVVTFCYVDGNLGKPAGFDTHLLEYRELFGRLESVQVVYVSTDQRTFAKARSTPVPRSVPDACFVGLLDDPESPVHQLVLVHRIALPLFPEKGTQPNVFYVPPFNPPKREKYGKNIQEDPRVPLDYLIYLFGPEVRDVIMRLEAELRKAQEGGLSEALQLLIGRDAETRYRIRPQLVQIQV